MLQGSLHLVIYFFPLPVPAADDRFNVSDDDDDPCPFDLPVAVAGAVLLRAIAFFLAGGG